MGKPKAEAPAPPGGVPTANARSNHPRTGRRWSPSLFWRTFLLILLLIIASLLTWLQSFRVFEREPRAERIANQVVSVVNVTRAALRYSDPNERGRLLAELADNVGIRVFALEGSDQVRPIGNQALTELVQEKVQSRLGAATRIAGEVNGVPGIWVSFDIEGDAYWAFIQRDLFARDIGTQWITWAVVAALLSLFAAVVITRLVNRPLQQLSRAALTLGAGRRPRPLPEQGPREIRAVNHSFNLMAADLAKLEEDRAVLLAGISHDLRTPLTRLRLELEMCELPESAREAMTGDLEQMDAIVGQFLEYARPRPQNPPAPLDLSTLVREVLGGFRLAPPDAEVRCYIEPGGRIVGYETELRRAIANLIANANHYGRSQDGTLRLAVELRSTDGQAVVVIADQGSGIAPERVEQLMRPFERGNTARSNAGGAGLGLAIVARIARLHAGELVLRRNVPSGLQAELRLSASPPTEILR
jgi:two-component system osmolarity sensor histidine kinase EnvZ